MINIIVIAVCFLFLTTSASTEGANDTRTANITDIFVKLAKLIPENVDPEELKQKIEEAFGSELLHENPMQLEDEGSQSQNETLDMSKGHKGTFHNLWNKTSEHFHNFTSNVKQKYRKFADYVKQKFSKKDLGKSQSDLWNLEQVTKQLAEQRIGQLNESVLNSTVQDVQKKSYLRDKWDKTKGYLKEKGHAVKQKLSDFGSYVKNKWNKTPPETETSKLEEVRKIAKEFIDNSKDMPKEAAEEGLEFFETLGKVFDDIKEKLNNTINH